MHMSVVVVISFALLITKTKFSSNHFISPNNNCTQISVFFQTRIPFKQALHFLKASSFIFHNCSVNFVGNTSGFLQQNYQYPTITQRRQVRIIKQRTSHSTWRCFLMFLCSTNLFKFVAVVFLTLFEIFLNLFFKFLRLIYNLVFL